VDDGRIYDALIIGAGPGGLTAAIYLRRFLRDIIVVHDDMSRAEWIPESHNFPGFVGGVSGPQLLERMRAQLECFGGGSLRSRVIALSRAGSVFQARTADKTISARSVVLATGVIDLNPALPGIEDVRKENLLRQCPVCDGYEFRNRAVAVLGDTEHAFREAQFLRSFCENVSIVSASKRMSGPGLDRRCAQAGLPFFGGATAASLEATGARRVVLTFGDGQRRDFDVVYSACGADVQSGLATNLGARTNEFGRLVVNDHCETSVKNLFAAGDVVEGLSQLVVASAHGAIAATAIHNRLPRCGNAR
jgi:thioredoxin reductase (NADPH)